MSRVLWVLVSLLALALAAALFGSASGQAPGFPSAAELQLLFNDAVSNRANRFVQPLETSVDLSTLNVAYSPVAGGSSSLQIRVTARRQLDATQRDAITKDLKDFIHEVLGQSALRSEIMRSLEERSTIQIIPLKVGPPDRVPSKNPYDNLPPGAEQRWPFNSNGLGTRSGNQSVVAGVAAANQPSPDRRFGTGAHCDAATYAFPAYGNGGCGAIVAAEWIAPTAQQTSAVAITADEIAAQCRPADLPTTFVSTAASPDLPQKRVGPDPNASLAAEFYGLGVHAYWRHDYATAVEQLRTATTLESQDARFWYFRGLAEQARGQRQDALHSFAAATQLVVDNQANAAALGQALARVQGPQRLVFQTAILKMRSLAPVLQPALEASLSASSGKGS